MTRAALRALLLSLPAFAEEKKAAPVEADKKSVAAAKKPRRGELKLDAMRVEGHIQKPSAFFILERQSLDSGALEKKESFLPKIVKSTEKEPF